ncbi:MAG: hypothetical protein JRN22_00760 [Nitrososphaerota archaeon]|nr:hypothetical protein [Nitrososphaerota archaeon]
MKKGHQELGKWLIVLGVILQILAGIQVEADIPIDAIADITLLLGIVLYTGGIPGLTKGK